MWLLTIFSTFLVHAMLLTGVVLLACSAFLGAIAFFRTYKFPIQLLGFALLGAGLYYEGAVAHIASQQLAVAKLETKLKAAEAESARLNTIVAAGFQKDVKTYYEKGDTIVKLIQSNAPEIDNKCVITPDVIDALNQAASIDVTTEVKKDKP